MATGQKAQTVSAPWSILRPKERRHRDLYVALLFLAPSLLGLFLLQVLPIGTALVLGVSEWNIIDPVKFVGLKNFVEVATDATFYHTLENTLYITVGLEVLNTLLGLCAALLLKNAMRGIDLYRTIYFLPLITTWAAVAIAWRYMYSLEGPINAMLGPLGIDPIPWLSRPEWAMPAVIITITWKTLSWKTIILLAGLQSIPNEFYEASSIDGASRLQQFWKITLPLLSPGDVFRPDHRHHQHAPDLRPDIHHDRRRPGRFDPDFELLHLHTRLPKPAHGVRGGALLGPVRYYSALYPHPMDLTETMGLLPVDSASQLKGVRFSRAPQGGSANGAEVLDET